MTKILLKYLSILTVVLLIANVAFAQVEKGKSRLEIGKKQSNNRVTVNTPLQRYAMLKPLPKEVSFNKPQLVTQYYRNSLLSESKGKVTNVEVAAKNSEATTSEPVQSNDKLYSSDKLTVSNIYPNPANDYTSVDYQISGNVDSATLTFYNILMQEVGTYELDKFDRKLRVSTSNWETGIYFYQLSLDGKKLITKKLLVRHN